MAFGVSRESISRLRKCAWYSAAVVGRPGGRSTGGVAMERPAYPARTGAGRPRSGAQAHAAGRTRAKNAWAVTAETPATSAPVAASNTQWLPVATTTKVTTGA